MPPTITLTGTGDPHVHMRQNIQPDGTENGMLDFAVAQTASWASFMLPMPNTIPSIRTAADYLAYAGKIHDVSPHPIELIGCLKAVEGFTTPEIIRDFAAAGGRAIKIYFEGVTTNANAGDAVTWEGLYEMADVWRACADAGLVICVHPEKPGVFSLEREAAAHDAIDFLIDTIQDGADPRLVVEHITDARTVQFLEEAPDWVKGTITVQHLWGDLDMIIGNHLNAHAFCKPVAKRPDDKRWLITTVLDLDPRYMFGSDTAPHTLHAKEHEGCAGCFTGPFCLQFLAHILDGEGCEPEDIEHILQAFCGDHARAFYRVHGPRPERVVTLERRPFVVPERMETATGAPVVPFQGGTELTWSLVN